MSNRDKARLILASVVVSGFFTLIGFAIFKPIEGPELQLVDVMVGALVAAFAGIVRHFFSPDIGER